MAKLPRVNTSTNRGGKRVKVETLYLPPWTEDLPDTTLITVKDIMSYNQVCRQTVLKIFPKTEKRRINSLFYGNNYSHEVYQWKLGALRQLFSVRSDVENK